MRFLAAFLISTVTACAADSVSGAFTIYMGAGKIANEQYSIQTADGKTELSGSGTANIGPMKIVVEKFHVVTNDQFQPISTEVKATLGQMQMQDSIVFADGKAKNKLNMGQGETVKEDDVHADALIVNSNLPLFAWSLLALRVKLDTTDPQTFNAYIVGQTEVPVTVTGKGKDTVEFLDRKAELNHFTMSFAPGAAAQPMNVDVWLTDDRKIIKIAVPSQNVEAYQDGFERKTPPPKVEAPKPEPK